ncbi:MAG: tyrosinase family protein [Boseongicola sp.]|nr:tyrosinase family protein [Boseongicola sp.]
MSGEELGRTTAMVRVRKDALDLTAQERTAFLEALATLNGHRRPLGPRDAYAKYARAHERASLHGIHRAFVGYPLFLAWHRAFLLSFERELQASHPVVTVPYWAFDERSDGVFVPDFMGAVAGGVEEPGGTLVNFDSSNPLSGWQLPNGVVGNGIVARFRNAVIPLEDYNPATKTVDEIIASPGGNSYSFANGDFELNYHNQAHIHVGGTLENFNSPADPLFFMLHANVDRGWAEWQHKVDRFDPDDEGAYSLQGVFPEEDGLLLKGSWSGDAMWPWSQEDGSATTLGSDDWPSAGFPFPAGVGPFGPTAPPTPGDMIDYMGVMGATPLEMCYDNLKWPT